MLCYTILHCLESQSAVMGNLYQHPSMMSLDELMAQWSHFRIVSDKLLPGRILLGANFKTLVEWRTIGRGDEDHTLGPASWGWWLSVYIPWRHSFWMVSGSRYHDIYLSAGGYRIHTSMPRAYIMHYARQASHNAWYSPSDFLRDLGPVSCTMLGKPRRTHDTVPCWTFVPYKNVCT